MSASAPVPGTPTHSDPVEAATDARGASTGDLRPLAERLRKAGELLEQRAAAATTPPWRSERTSWAHENVAGRVSAPRFVSDTRVGVGHATHADADWIALMGPQVAAPLAAWLRAEADHAALFAALDEPAPGTVRVQLSTATEALALADVILAEVTQ